MAILPDLRQLKAADPTVEYFDVETGEFQKVSVSERKIKYGRPYAHAGTFGPARAPTPIRKVQICTKSRIAAYSSLGVANGKRRLRLPRSSKRKELVDAHIAWLTDQQNNWDLAVSLHLPFHLSHTKDALPTLIIEKHLGTFFRRVEKRVFSRTERIRLRKKLGRLIVLEDADSVGFHLHMAMLLPIQMNLTQFVEILKDLWIKFWAGQRLAFPHEHAVWAEAITGEYVSYSLKNIGTDQAEVLWSSCHL